MPDYNLSRLSMDELGELFIIRQEIVELAERTNSDQAIIDENKKQLKEIKEAMDDKRSHHFSKNSY